MRIIMTMVVAATRRTKTDTPAAITNSMFGVLCVGDEVGVTALVEVGMVAPAHTGSLRSLILTGQLGSNVTMENPVVNVAPCLTHSSIWLTS